MRRVTVTKGAKWAHQMALDGAFRVTSVEDVSAIAGEPQEERKVFLISLLSNWSVQVSVVDLNAETAPMKAVFEALRNHHVAMAVPITQLPTVWDNSDPMPTAEWWETKAIENLLKL